MIVSDLFEVIPTRGESFYKMEGDQNGLPFVSRQSTNNGVAGRVKRKPDTKPHPAYTISVAAGGSVMECFLQEEPYYAAYHVFCLKPKRKLSRNEMLFYCTALRMNRFRFNYGRQANRTLPSLKIPSPDEIPNWVHEYKIPTAPNSKPKSNADLNLSDRPWKRFSMPQLFEITGANKKVSLRVVESYGKGNKPYVTTRAEDNGVRGFYDYATEEGGVITFDSAVKGYCAYQAESFSASDHVEKLIPRFPINTYIALFLVTLLNKEQFRYNYGRKCSQERMALISIKLPVNREGNPDWEFMENYIKSLPYSSNL